MSQFGIIKTQGMIERAIENAEEGELIIFPETALILLKMTINLLWRW